MKGNHVRIVVYLISALALGACSPAPVQPEPTLTLLDEFSFDFATDGGDVPVSGPVLEAGRAYIAEIRGTYSAWPAGTWGLGVCLGEAESAPMFPSPGAENSLVGLDPEFLFAAPEDTGACDRQEVLPRHTSRFDVSLDDGATWTHLEPIGGQPTAPNPDHAYRYELTGGGHPFQVRHEDDRPEDDYGVFMVSVFRVD